MSPRLRAALFPGLLCGAGALLTLFHRVLFLDENFVSRDHFAFYRAARSLISRLVAAQGGLPDWNPYFAQGQPFAANPEHALFHPATWPFLFLPFEWAYRLHVLVPFTVAPLGMALLVRSLGRSRAAAAFAGLAWGFSGFAVSATNLLPLLLSSSALPFVLAFARRLALRGKGRDLWGVTIAFAVCCAGGEASVLLAMAPLVVAVVLSPPRPDRPGFRRLAGGLVAGLLLAAPVLLPALALGARTRRAAGLPAAWADLWSLPPLRVLEWLAPWAMGQPDGAEGFGAYWGLPLYGGRTTPFIYSLYPGVAVTLLGLAALLLLGRPGRRRAWPWLVLGGSGLLVAFGVHLPLWGWLRVLPVFSGLRYPERFVLLPCLATCLLAALAFDAARARRRVRRAVAVLALVLGGGLALAALGLRASAWMPGLVSPLAAGALGCLAAALLVAAMRSSRADWLVAATVLELAIRGLPIVASLPVAALTPPPALLRPLLDDPAAGPIFHLAAWVSQKAAGYSLVRPPLPAFWGVPMALEADFDLTELRWSAETTEATLELLERDRPALMQVLRRRGVRAILRLRDDARVRDGWLLAAPGVGVVAEARFVDRPRPFAWFAKHVRRAGDLAAWRSGLGLGAADVVCLEPGSRAPLDPGTGRVLAAARFPDEATVEVEVAETPAVLALNQTWDVFWKATIDGVPAELERADVALMALVVPPGRHSVRLAYRDPWLRVGLALAALACAALVAGPHWRNKKKGPAGAGPSRQDVRLT